MESQTINIREVITENKELKRALALSLNQPLIIKLKSALNRIKSGEYLTEEEFFKP